MQQYLQTENLLLLIKQILTMKAKLQYVCQFFMVAQDSFLVLPQQTNMATHIEFVSSNYSVYAKISLEPSPKVLFSA